MKNKILFCICILLVIGILLCLYSVGKYNALCSVEENTPINIEIKLSKIELVENNSVGDSWTFDSSVNGTQLNKGSSIKLFLKPNDKIDINVKATEEDSVPDVGKNSTSISLNSLTFNKANEIPINVTVRENRGRYSGHIAEWKYIFKITREVSFKDIINNIFK